MKKASLIALLLAAFLGKGYAQTVDEEVGDPTVTDPSAAVVPEFDGSRLLKFNGFRVQIYYGANTRESRLQANEMAERSRKWFDSVPVYVNFLNPHWVCRVGNFLTHKEAEEMLKEMRISRRFPSAVIVKSRVVMSYNEYAYKHQAQLEEIEAQRANESLLRADSLLRALGRRDSLR